MIELVVRVIETDDKEADVKMFLRGSEYNDSEEEFGRTLFTLMRNILGFKDKEEEEDIGIIVEPGHVLNETAKEEDDNNITIGGARE